MNLLIILSLTLAISFALPSKEIKSRNILVPAGQPEGRVTHGQNAVKGQFPYQVGLSLLARNKVGYWCGGSIIDNEWILTAAHCTEDAIEAMISLGSTDRKSEGLVHYVTDKNIIIHPDYNTDTLENDISLIKIPYTAYSENIQPIKLPPMGTSYASYAGDNVIASGWGATNDLLKTTANHLQWAHLNVIPNRLCRNSFKIYSSNICTSTLSGVNICDGDSGGPLVLESSKVQIGITSFGAKICIQSAPAVYTRTTSFLGWIKGHTGVSY